MEWAPSELDLCVFTKNVSHQLSLESCSGCVGRGTVCKRVAVCNPFLPSPWKWLGKALATKHQTWSSDWICTGSQQTPSASSPQFFPACLGFEGEGWKICLWKAPQPYLELDRTGEVVAAVSPLLTAHDMFLKQNTCGAVSFWWSQPYLLSPISFLLLIW